MQDNVRIHPQLIRRALSAISKANPMIRVRYATRMDSRGNVLSEISEIMPADADYKLRAKALNWHVLSVENQR